MRPARYGLDQGEPSCSLSEPLVFSRSLSRLGCEAFFYSLEHTPCLQVWRHSTLANFYLHRIASGDSPASSRPQTHPLLKPSSPPLTSLALFSPTRHHLAYVHANDLYILPASRIDTEPRDREKGWEGEAIRITKDGSQTVMSGRPSWVYEEEVGRPDLPYYQTSPQMLKVVRLVLC